MGREFSASGVCNRNGCEYACSHTEDDGDVMSTIQPTFDSILSLQPRVGFTSSRGTMGPTLTIAPIN